MNRSLFSSVFFCLLLGCMACVPQEEIVEGIAVQEQFYLVHQGAQMPVLVEGNTESNTFILIVHGGPGGNAMVYNDLLGSFSNPLEEKYAMVYWDQRGSGNSLGNYGVESVTVNQFVEDLDVLVDLLFARYGQDIQVFLLGHSWGGTLTAAYLSQAGNQDKIAGWIEVDGAHNFPLINETTPAELIRTGREQIPAGNRVDEWTEIVDYCENLTQPLSLAEILQVNRYANVVESYLIEAGITTQSSLQLGEAVRFYFFSNHNFMTSFFNSSMTSRGLLEELVFNSYSEDMKEIRIPSLFLWGRHDLVVPPVLADDAFHAISTPPADKSIYIFEDSGHSPMAQQPEEFSLKLIQFVEKYR
ncbi:MAG: alpha/beta hydrolase [Bacteroidota bacterium]